ncbi:TPA: stress response small protein YobI, partial [Escherichia coli]|nr:stress response small protein YobI [Escherichia coli]HBB6453828.1 stress response small protein YobI [Escherichia coli]HBM2217220.1 stress response small protein YobI [Escherichia coli]HBM2263697.1 stress response small protein YobI [Escherichia coli]HCQ3838040.1 stress response small protein YobI [Escherichia coli]
FFAEYVIFKYLLPI